MALLDLQGIETTGGGGGRSTLSVTGCPGKSSLSILCH
jgi:hypothetical protein